MCGGRRNLAGKSERRQDGRRRQQPMIGAVVSASTCGDAYSQVPPSRIVCFGARPHILMLDLFLQVFEGLTIF